MFLCGKMFLVLLWNLKNHKYFSLHKIVTFLYLLSWSIYQLGFSDREVIDLEDIWHVPEWLEAEQRAGTSGDTTAKSYNRVRSI